MTADFPQDVNIELGDSLGYRFQFVTLLLRHCLLQAFVAWAYRSLEEDAPKLRIGNRGLYNHP